MATNPVGWWDESATSKGWWDETAENAGWWDELAITVTSGGATTITGTLAVTDSADSAAFSGDHGQDGTLAATDGTDTATFSGDVAHVGALAATDGADTAAFSGDVCHVGTLAVTDGADTAAADGTVTSGPVTITGDLAATDSADSFAVSGDIDHAGSLNATDVADSFAAYGEIEHVGTLTATDGEDTAVFVGDNCHVGDLAATEPSDSCGIYGYVDKAFQGGGWFGYGYGLSRRGRTEDEIRKERIRLGILPPEVEQAVTKAVETAVAKREEPDEAIDLQAAENALRADLARMDRQVTDAIRRLLYLEYARIEQEYEEAQIVMLLFDM